MDGEYEIQIRLTRDRNEHVEGLTEPHELELLLDGERVQAVHREAAAATSAEHHATGRSAPEDPRSGAAPGRTRSASRF